jgi:hypothetical protein
MRLEIIVPDNTSPEVKRKLTRLSERLSDHPELVEDLVSEEADSIPDYMASIAQIRRSPNRFKTSEEVDAYIAGLRAEW